MKAFDVIVRLEQGLQRMGVFSDEDMFQEEMMLQLNRVVLLYVDNIFRPKEKRDEGFQDIQKTVDDIRELHINNAKLSLTDLGAGPLGLTTFIDDEDGQGGKEGTLPLDYFHLINDRSRSSYSCYVDGKQATKYIVKPNRLTDQEELYEVLDYSFSQTKKEKPVSNITSNKLRVFENEDFVVVEILIDYVKQPTDIELVLDGGGLQDDGASTDPELHDNVMLEIIDITVARIAKIIEADQQKIVNLQSETV